ncbi:MAG: hypothetical protein IMW98_04680 [Firmicutes bacterium]|nr:hypothetical protein [Bacillota bacterium]
MGAAAASGLPLALLTPAQRAAWPWWDAAHAALGAVVALPLLPAWARHAAAYLRQRRLSDGFALSGAAAWAAAALAVASGLALELHRPAPPWLGPLHGLFGLVAAGAALAHLLAAFLQDA